MPQFRYLEKMILEHPPTSLTDQEDRLSETSTSYLKNDLHESVTPFLALQYDGFIPIIVGAIQEQQAEINSTRKLHSIAEKYEKCISSLEEQLKNTNKKLAENSRVIIELKSLLHSIDK